MKQYISERITLINCLAPPHGEQDTDRMKAEDDNRKMNLHLSLSFIHIPVVCSLLFPVLIVSLNQAGPPSLLCWHRDRRAHSVSVMNTNPDTLLLATAQPQRSTTSCSPVIKLPTVLIRGVKLRFVSCCNVQLDPSSERRHPIWLKYNGVSIHPFWTEFWFWFKGEWANQTFTTCLDI